MSSANRRLVLALVALAVLAVFAAGCGRGMIAKVNGRKITRQEYYDRLERLEYTDPATGQRNEAGAAVLDRLITEELVLRLAEKEKVGPTEQQVKERLEETMKMPGAAAKMKQMGLSKEEFKERLRVEQAAFNLQTKGVHISNKEARDFYEQKKELPPFTTQETAAIAAVFLNSKAESDKAVGLLKKGVDFGTVASMLSRDPDSSKRGGRLARDVVRGDPNIPEGIQNIIFSTPTNKYTKPIAAGQGGYVIFKVVLHRPKKTRSFSEFEYIIKQQLTLQKGINEKKIDINKQLGEFRKTAKIEVAIERYKPLVSQAQGKAPVTPPASSPKAAPKPVKK